MPTLLSINNYYFRRGGAEVVFLEQNRLLEKEGWGVIPFSMTHEKNLSCEWSPYFVDEIEFGQKYSMIEKIGHAMKVIYSFESRNKMQKLLGNVHPNIAHAHNVYHHISPSFFSLLQSYQIPTVLTLHDLKLACPAYKMLTHDGVCERCKAGAIWNVMLHKCVKNSRTLSSIIFVESAVHRLLGCYSNSVDRFIVPSFFYLEKFVEWGWTRNKFSYLPNFVDITSHVPDEDIGKAFIYFGRLGSEKGLKTFIKAAARVDVPIWIVGTGPEESSLKDLAAVYGTNVTFFGYKTGNDLHELIRRSRAMVLPSEWFENAPMSVLESYALGRPVIGANIGGIPELIRISETGDIFESGNEIDLADKLRIFVNMPDTHIAAMGKAGRDWVEREFTAQKYIERLVSIYAELGVKY